MDAREAGPLAPSGAPWPGLADGRNPSRRALGGTLKRVLMIRAAPHQLGQGARPMRFFRGSQAWVDVGLPEKKGPKSRGNTTVDHDVNGVLGRGPGRPLRGRIVSWSDGFEAAR